MEPKGERLTTKQYSQRYGVPVRTVNNWAKAGKLERVKLPSGNYVVQGPFYPIQLPIKLDGRNWMWVDWDTYCKTNTKWDNWNLT